MRILSRYFVSGYLTYYAAIVLVSLLVIAIVEMMVNFDHVTEYGEGLVGMASYLFLRLPSYYLPFLIPIGSFGAAFLCLGLPARSLEILAAKTSGISPVRLAAPVLVTASIASVAALVLNETIVLDAARSFNSEADAEIFQSRGSFWYQRGQTLFGVESADRDSRTLRGVTVYERDAAGRLVRSIRAASAHIEDDDRRWRLEDARFHEFDVDDPLAAPQSETREDAWLELGSAEDLALLGADARSLSLLRLRAQIAALERDDRDASRYRAQWHARLADPLSVVLFALLGAPLGMVVERSRSLAVAALHAIALLGGYYGLQTTATIVGTGGADAAAFAPWVVQALFASYGAWRLAQASR